MALPIDSLQTSLPFTGPGQAIDIWLTYYDDIVSDQHLTMLRSLLSDDEVSQEGRFYFADDRKRYLVTRAMVRMLLSRHAKIAPRDWKFSKNPYGRPVIAGTLVESHAHVRGLCFNVSHTRGVIAVAIARDRELGIDIEHTNARHVSLDVAHHFFSPIEVSELSCVPPDRQQDRFFEYWTLKESYIKARGMGLSLPLDHFSFGFSPPGTVDLSTDADLQDRADRWSFWQYRLSTDYLMAICAERFLDDVPVISMRKFTPLGEEMPVVLAPLRQSTNRRAN